MTATAPPQEQTNGTSSVRRWIQRHGWTVGIWIVLAILGPARLKAKGTS